MAVAMPKIMLPCNRIYDPRPTVENVTAKKRQSFPSLLLNSPPLAMITAAS